MKREILRGQWIALEPLDATNAQDVEQLDRQRELQPQMGGVFHRGLPSRLFGQPLAIRSLKKDRIVGVISNQEVDEFPGVCCIVLYVDQKIARPGWSIEAFALYTNYVFSCGAERILLEVAEFNFSVLGILRKANVSPKVCLRESLYIAGDFWNTYLFEFNQAEWSRILERYRVFLPGGGKRLAALGSTKIQSIPEQKSYE